MRRARRAGAALRLSEQLMRMRFGCPSFDSKITGNKLLAVGRVQPTPLCGVYRVRVEYEPGEYPRAYVLDPTLEPRAPDGAIPHVYRDPVLRPCLFRPTKGEWTSAMSIAASIVPWLELWLFYYEVWHATGDWLGGGEHPPPAEPDPLPEEVTSLEDAAR
jgi:hypothetical protein